MNIILRNAWYKNERDDDGNCRESWFAEESMDF